MPRPRTEEGVLRQRVTTDIATKGGQFDVMSNSAAGGEIERARFKLQGA